jgi:hypothetical protein
MDRPKLTRKKAKEHKQRKRGEHAVVLPEYHQLVFQEIAEETRALRSTAALEAVADRTGYWCSPERVGTWRDEEAWDLLHAYLQRIETRIRSMVVQHSLYYWLHLYRRIGVGLHPLLDPDPEEMTVTLVRNILEVAFVKYGVIDGSVDDMGLSSEMSLEEIAGGLYVRKLRASILRAQGDPESILATLGSAIQSSGAWLLKRFVATDYVDVFRLESLAYEYWLTTARMRRVGKGGAIVVSEQGDVATVRDDKLETLVNSYDDRIDKMPFVASSAGVAFYAAVLPGELPIVAAFYNVEKRKCSDVCLSEEMRESFPTLQTNFLLGQMSLSAFATAHSFAGKAVRTKFGFSLESFCAYISAVSVWALSNAQSPTAKQHRLSEWKELYQRGYVVYPTAGLEATIAETANVISDDWLGVGKHCMAEDASRVHAFLTLASEKRKQPGLWSLGPRYVFLPYERATVVDFQALLVVLQNFLVNVSHEQSSKGTAFEVEFRKYAADSQLNVLPQRILNDGSANREADALIRCKTTLFICECRAMERPMDFEIGRVKTIKVRTADLSEKVHQSHTLAAFLRKTPRGANYDFSWAEKVVPLVVSPFVEWIWARGEELWLDSNTPRILSAEEAVRYMKAA